MVCDVCFGSFTIEAFQLNELRGSTSPTINNFPDDRDLLEKVALFSV